MADPTSIDRLWKAFDINSNVGSACGDIVALKGTYGKCLINALVAGQNFEYKMTNTLDKALKSMFGYNGTSPCYLVHLLHNGPFFAGAPLCTLPFLAYLDAQMLDPYLNGLSIV